MGYITLHRIKVAWGPRDLYQMAWDSLSIYNLTRKLKASPHNINVPEHTEDRLKNALLDWIHNSNE